MPDFAIFANTAEEPEAVYKWLAWICFRVPFPIYVVTAGRKLSDDVRAATLESGPRFASVPFFSKSIESVTGAAGTKIGEKIIRGRGRQHCTSEFKLNPIYKRLRKELGYKPGQRIPPNSVTSWIGISTDEIIRMKPSTERWIINRHPLIELGMSREDCKRWLKEHNYTMPPKSACVFCPWRSNAGWRNLRDNSPEEFERACNIDDIIRSNGTLRGMESPQYIHDSLVPLRMADIETDDPRQPDLFGNECEGMCGV